jgi:class 3 adenylate cyclase/CheY-like chemotaxis protein
MTTTNEKATLLVVDDTADNLTLLNDLLRDTYRVLLAKNGEKALGLARDQKPDLVLLDIMMPEMDGWEVCRRLKADPETRDIPILFLTAMDSDQDEAKGLELGAVDYITKPISPPIVLARVATHLTLKRARQFLVDQNAFLEAEVARRLVEIERIQDVFGKIVDPRVRDFLLTHGQVVGGEVTQGAVMFCDIRGFTAFSESRDPRAVVSFLNRFFTEAAACVEAEGGLINKYLGDAFMAVFGTPFPLSDLQGAAIRAAQAIRQTVVRLNAQDPSLHFAIGIGIACGPMVAGIVGSPQRMEFTTIGDTVNTASRLESLCKEFKTDLVVTASLLEGTPWEGKARALGTTSIRGKETGLELFTLEADRV